MPHLITRATVTDYERWHELHSDQIENLKTATVRSEILCRDTADPNTVVLIQEVDDAKAFMDFFQSPELQAVIASAPLKAPPEVWVLEEVERPI